jgi:protein SCO1/2
MVASSAVTGKFAHRKVRKYSEASTYNVAMNTPPSRSRVSPAWLIVFAALATAIGAWVGSRLLTPAPLQLQNAVLYPAPRTVPDFHLTQANGKPLTLDSWRGHWTVAYFGYSNCPDVCPTTLVAFKQAWKDLAQRDLSKHVQIDFISVDPERDTPEQLGKYVAFFSPDFVAATGSDDELNRLTRALGLIYSRSKDANGAIQVDHSGSAVILDPQARMVGIFRPPFTGAAIADDLAVLVPKGL